MAFGSDARICRQFTVARCRITFLKLNCAILPRIGTTLYTARSSFAPAMAWTGDSISGSEMWDDF